MLVDDDVVDVSILADELKHRLQGRRLIHARAGLPRLNEFIDDVDPAHLFGLALAWDALRGQRDSWGFLQAAQHES